jgi:hypothetical protein
VLGTSPNRQNSLLFGTTNSSFVGAYIDLNGNDILDIGDIRLNRFESRLPYKALVAGDPDLEANLPPNLVWMYGKFLICILSMQDYSILPIAM